MKFSNFFIQNFSELINFIFISENTDHSIIVIDNINKIVIKKFQIPLIIQGENPGLTLGASLTAIGKDSDALKAEQLHTLSEGWQRYLKVEGIEESDLFLFHYNRKILEDMKDR